MSRVRRWIQRSWRKLRHPPRWLRRVGGLLRPTDWTALALLSVTAVFVVLDVAVGLMKDWAPNIAAAAASIALTISIVDRIVSREVGRAFRLRRRRLLSEVFQAIEGFAWAAFEDYRETHLDEPREKRWGGEQLNSDSRRMIRFWEQGLETETNEPRRDEQGRRRMLSFGLTELEKRLAAARASAQEIEDHESVLEIENCLETVQSTNKLLAMERDGHSPVDEERLWLQHIAFMLGILAEYVTKNWGWPLVFD